MFFGKRKDEDSTQPKRRSTLGLLFNPDIGASIRPLGEATTVFVRLIAMIFAMNGLFPKNHPALLDEPNAPRLSLPEIFRTAWAGLEFTPAGMPKVVLFVAVAGTMILAILSIVTALMAGFMGSAHAAAPPASNTIATAFSPATSDLAQGWLDFIFKGVPLQNYFSQAKQQIPSGNGLQCAMMGALGYYSLAMLVFAGFILFYHLIAMVAHTAHDGVVMGKRANQVWAPIRLVFAIGLLVPVGGASSCATVQNGGLNSGQYIVIKMASLGSGLASQTWAAFLNNLVAMQVSAVQPNPPYVIGVARDIAMMEACRFDWNYNLCLVASGGDPTQCANPNDGVLPSGLKINPALFIAAPVGNPNEDGSTTFKYTSGSVLGGGTEAICGEYMIPAPIATATTPATVGPTANGVDPVTIAVDLSKAQIAAAQSFVTSLQSGNLPSDILLFEPSVTNPGNENASLPINSDFVSAVTDYQTGLSTQLATVVAGYQGAAGLSSADAASIASLGWAAAGAWLNTIARDQGVVVNAYQNGLPKTTPPTSATLSAAGFPGNLVAPNLDIFGQWLSGGYGAAAQTLPTPTDPCALQGIAAGGAINNGAIVPGDVIIGAPLIAVDQGIIEQVNVMADPIRVWLKKILSIPPKDALSGDTMDIATRVIDIEAGKNGVWNHPASSCTQQGTFSLGQQLVSANPLAELAFWGYANLRTAYSLWDDIFEISRMSVATKISATMTEFTNAGVNNTKGRTQIMEAGINNEIVSFFASLFSMIAMIFFTCGYTLAFVVPLLPFFRFFFNVLTWIASVLEAVVAIPLVALAHLNPEGEGLSGQSAKAAYFMIFNIFMRPVLTVFGLVAGLL